MKKIAYALIIPLLFTNLACAEDAKSPVSSVQSQKEAHNHSHGEAEGLELTALTYEGTDFFGKTCTLYVSAIEEEHDGEHHHEFLAKVDYSLHGQTPLDTVVEFQKYDTNAFTYYPADSTASNATPALVSAVLKDDASVDDYNDLATYQQSGNLVQSLLINFNDVDLSSLESAMEEVIEDNTKFANNKDTLNQLNSMVIKLGHAGHYDSVICPNLKLTGMTSVEFELDEHADDHDH